jgi:hypothetical protein
MRGPEHLLAQTSVGLAAEPPRAGVLVDLPRAPVGRGEVPDLEERVIHETAHEALAHDAGGAKNGDRNPTHRSCFISVKLRSLESIVETTVDH